MASKHALSSIARCYPGIININTSCVSPKYSIESSNKFYSSESTLKNQESPSTAGARHWKEIPGPKSYPLVGSLFGFVFHKEFDIKNITKIIDFWGKEYGSIVLLESFIGLPNMVMISDPSDVEIFLRSTAKTPVRFHFASLKKIREETPNNYFNKRGGLLPENNEEWWRVRSRVQTPMMKLRNIHQYLHRMDEVALDFVELVSRFQKDLGEMPENFLDELYKWALESIGLVALNRRLGCFAPDLADDSHPMKLINAANDMMEGLAHTELYQTWRLFRTSKYLQLKKAHQIFLELADEDIIKLEAEIASKGDSDESQPTLMETLLRTPGLTRVDVVTIILDMLFAGIDTTSHSVAFLLYLLTKNPEAQRKLQKELDDVLGDGKDGLKDTHLARLSYLKCCLKETLRLYPIVTAIARLIQEDLVLSGYLVPKGTNVFSLNYLTSRDEKVFPRADEFIPERWQRKENLGPINPYASLPFSHGPRMCIGRRIAEQEILSLTSRLLHRFNIEYKYGDMGMATRFILIPSKPLRFTFTERSK